MKTIRLFPVLLLALSCANPSSSPTAKSPANVEYFKDGRVDIQMEADGLTWSVKFTDLNGTAQTVTGKTGAGTVFDQNGLQVVLSADKQVQFVSTAYIDASSRKGTETYTVSMLQYTATDVKTVKDSNSKTITDYTFAFANPSTGVVAYTASLVNTNGKIQVLYKNASGAVTNTEDATVTYNADSSRIYAFSNICGYGEASVSVNVPAVYAGVQGTLFVLAGKLEVYAKTDGTTIVDYYDAAAPVTPHHYVVLISRTIQTMYTSMDGNTTLQVGDGSVIMDEKNVVRYCVGASEIVCEQVSVAGAKQYTVHFINESSGLPEVDAVILSTGTVATFGAPVNASVDVNWQDDNTALEFTFSNAVASGTVSLSLDDAGNVNDVYFTQP